MKRQALSVCLAGTMLLGFMAAPAMALSVDKLTDVKKTDWFYPYVQYVTEKEYMVGVSDDLFAPTMEMSRAMFVTILYRLDGAVSTSENAFTDVPDNTWYTQAVNWAAENKIVSGIGNNKFAPEDPITREQMCVIMTNFLAYRAEKDEKTFRTTVEEKTFLDADSISAFAKEAVKQCQMWGLISGNEKGYFNPLDHSTRAEVATVIRRLDKLLASGESSTDDDEKPGTGGGGGGGGSAGGGGGGGTVDPTPTPTTETASYTITASIQMPEDVTTFVPEVWKEYDVKIQDGNVTGDQLFGTVLTDLTTGNNANAIQNCVNEALNRVKGKTTTQTLNGQQVTVSVSEDGVISAFVAVKVTDFTGDKTRVSQEELEALITKLQKGGNMEFSAADLPVMEDLLTKIEDVQKMDPQEIQEKIDQVKDEKPELAQVVSGMTPDAILEAAGSYQEELTQIKDQVQQAVDSGATGPIVIKKKPVLMNVAMDLGAYYDQAVKKFENETTKNNAISRLELNLYPSAEPGVPAQELTEDQKAKAGAVYDLNNPAHYVTNNKNGTLTLKSAGDYVLLVRSNVAASADFYASLGEDADFYADLLTRAENKYQEGYDVTYTGSIQDMAALLGDADGIFVDEAKAFRNGMTFFIEVTADEGTYKSWLELISGKFSQAGNILPGQMPKALDTLLGDYTLTFTIDKE